MMWNNKIRTLYNTKVNDNNSDYNMTFSLQEVKCVLNPATFM